MMFFSGGVRLPTRSSSQPLNNIASTTEDKTCIMCPRVGSKKCNGCGFARYCSKECQALDWKLHKLLCKSFKDPKPDISKETRISKVVRAILFPGSDANPKLVYVKTWRVGESDENGEIKDPYGLGEASMQFYRTPAQLKKEIYGIDEENEDESQQKDEKDDGNGEAEKAVAREAFDRFDHGLYFGDAGPDTTSTFHNLVQARDLGRNEDESLVIWGMDNSMKEPDNEGIVRFTRAGIAEVVWRGPQLVMRELKGPYTCVQYLDVEPRDARMAADFFSCAFRGRKLQHVGTKLLAATIENAIGSGGRERFGERAINADDIVYSKKGCSIANLLGLPLQMRADPYSKQAQPIITGSRFNEDAELLKRDINGKTTGSQVTAEEMEEMMRLFKMLGSEAEKMMPNSTKISEQGFGKSPTDWEAAQVGSVLAARSDGLLLLGRHLEVLCAYIREKVEPMLKACIDGVAPGLMPKKRDEILNTITRKSFEQFFQEYKARKVLVDQQWADLPSMYAMKKASTQWKGLIEELYEEQKSKGFKQWTDTFEISWCFPY